MKNGKSARAGGSAEQVKAVQQALKDKGHDPGEVDGKMGPKTQQALRDYQQKEGLKATGRLDSETAAKLGVQAKADTSTSPAASPSGASSPSAAPSAPSSSGGASGSSSTGAKTK
jgi:peptidoglycan hydrolase-like protein with peptidoglycan-binding domain